MSGTDGRVYGGDCNLVHIADGTRAEVGKAVATFLEKEMRARAALAGKPSALDVDLCPGCVMIALLDAAIHLADANGQSRTELGATLGKAFAVLAANPASGCTEEIEVILDPEHERRTFQAALRDVERLA